MYWWFLFLWVCHKSGRRGFGIDDSYYVPVLRVITLVGESGLCNGRREDAARVVRPSG